MFWVSVRVFYVPMRPGKISEVDMVVCRPHLNRDSMEDTGGCQEKGVLGTCKGVLSIHSVTVGKMQVRCQGRGVNL